MAIGKEEVLEFLGAEENKNFLIENGFQSEIKVEVEKIVEKELELTDERVGEYLKNKPELINNYTTEAIIPIVEEIKKNLVSKLLEKNEYKDLLIPKIDVTKVEVTGEGITGLDEQLENLKTIYPNLFSTNSKDTPPLKKTDASNGEVAKLESEIESLKQNPSITNRALISQKLREIEKIKNKK